LGESIESVAAEKAGILKKRVPGVIAPQPDAALAVIETAAARVRAPLMTAGEHWQISEERGRLVYQDDDGLLDLPAPRLPGRHQFVNAGTAIAALRAAGFTLPHAAYETGLLKADWPARMQRLPQGKLSALAPAGSELWLDGGHNPDGGHAIAAAIGDLEERVPRPLVAIIGMLQTKDCEGFLRNFAGLARLMFAIPIPHQDKSMTAGDLRDKAMRLGIPAQEAESVEAALAAAAKLALEPAPRILMTGSLYLAGEILKANGTLPE
jgi:dihydrofolate synthase/folylpolyglutamate synthase